MPTYDDLFQPVIDALNDLGGSARPLEVAAHIASALNLSDDALSRTIKDSTSLFRNRVQWARHYLAQTGYIDSSRRGVWSLTELGATAKLSGEDASRIRREVKRKWKAKSPAEDSTSAEELPSDDESVQNDVQEVNYREELIAVIRDLPPDGFERLCQRLLRESGFEKVTVTGKSGDGGIDGHGILAINPFVSFQVLFQCKRYQGSVGAGAVRDFRGAMQGRAYKGLVITTGNFTESARGEASRDGVPPIELVDGQGLIDLFENLELGLTPRKVFDVDDKFFDEFRR